ncbi:efflux transporter outer membrane subunit [Sphingomonas sp. CGMCC 1.13654]|uniref:Efflux transporter outer membrane subunit n=1 Tax=Sphingomonas chungangi TaxID=2683589 RepID=A0A838LAP9_9SPHN|nr:efflux transporter outer membrane subunit [Sphingomonas chungangi]MBA2935912.1 efflux transporter outer membrane subunit [Sphingomonas chungangi]MVW54603.1 efflux transporter outer membrane subunit [Sphingomonas chungangi]
MRAPALATALLAFGLIGGCAVGPDYHRPVLAAPAAFIGTPAVTDRIATTTASAADSAWWSGFGDPVLTGLVNKALAQNLDIAQAVARVAQARAGLHGADAALLPSGEVTASAAALRLSKDTLQGQQLSALGVSRNQEAYGGDLGASWEIDLFGGLRRDREAAFDEYQGSRAGVAAARLSIAAEVADTYIAIRGLQARIAVANEQVATQQQLVATIGLQYRKGVAAELQLRQAEGALAQVKGTVPELQVALDGALNALDVLAGEQPGTERALLAAPGAIPAAPAITGIGSPADLLQRRPDLIVAERKLAASNARIGSAISEYYPKISLTGLIGSAATGPASLFTGGAFQAQGAAGLRWRLFDFGRVDAEIKNARGRNAEALAAYRLSVLRASEDVENAFSALVNREQQQRTLADGENSLARAQQSSMAAYKGGVVSLIEVLDADTRLLQTRDALAQARTESAEAAVASFRSLGGGWGSVPIDDHKS